MSNGLPVDVPLPSLNFRFLATAKYTAIRGKPVLASHFTPPTPSLNTASIKTNGVCFFFFCGCTGNQQSQETVIEGVAARLPRVLSLREA